MSPHDSLRIMGCTLKQTGPHRNRVELTAAERVLVHLHGFWNVSEPGRESTQAGIAEGARLLRSHVPRTLKALQDEGLADSRDTRLRGQRRKIRVYILTEAGVRQARQILGDIDRTTVVVDGRTTTMGEARKALGLTGLAALAATDPAGRLQPRGEELERPTLLQRDQDLAVLRRWLVGGAPVAVIYGSRGMGKTALGWAFAKIVPKSVWVDLPDGSDLKGFAASLASATGVRPTAPGEPESVADALRRIYLLTKGCPRYLQAIREGDEASLRAHSRFTHAEIRLLLYSGGSTA